MSSRNSLPAYRLHKASGQARVTIDGKDHYLGKFGSPASHERYRRLLAEWRMCGDGLDPTKIRDIAVTEIIAGFFAQLKVCKAQTERYKQSLGVLRELYGESIAKEFGPLALEAVRSEMIARGWSRRYCNSCVGLIRTCWRWATARELIPAERYQALKALRGLRAGEGGREIPRVKPVPEADLLAVLDRGGLLPAVACILRLQWLTGARPGELLPIRGEDIDQRESVWVYRPVAHKCEWRGQDRVIYFGPRAQEILKPWIREGYLFSPAEQVKSYQESQGQQYQPGELRKPGACYTIGSYGRAITKACKRAGVKPFHAHQVRHTAATKLVAEFGWDTARILLGHRTLDATRIYAEDQTQRASEAAKKVG